MSEPSGTLASISVEDSVAELMRRDAGRLLSVLIGQLRDFQLAEDSLQDALESALTHWRRNGLPRSPAAWLMQTARRKAIDRLRRAARFRDKSAEIAALVALEAGTPDTAEDPIADERLRLIFTCCHPAIDTSISVALSLRSICGLTTEAIARAFVVPKETMAQRLVRARHKITAANIPYDVPGRDGWAERLGRVLDVIYLMFNEGYSVLERKGGGGDLCAEAIRLCTVLNDLCPDEAEARGLWALMRLNHARYPARTGADGVMIALEHQDRGLWHRSTIDEAAGFLQDTLRLGRAGPLQIQAAISALHCEAESFEATDWLQIVGLYDLLCAMQPNPVWKLNRIVAASYVHGPVSALAALSELSDRLGDYQPYHAARADILARTGDIEGAQEACERAIALSASETERAFLRARFKAV